MAETPWSLCLSPRRYFHPGSEPLELDSRFWALRDSIVQCELLMLRVLRFQVSFQHPHKVPAGESATISTGMNLSVFDPESAPTEPSRTCGICAGQQRRHRRAPGLLTAPSDRLRRPLLSHSPGLLRQFRFLLLPPRLLGRGHQPGSARLLKSLQIP